MDILDISQLAELDWTPSEEELEATARLQEWRQNTIYKAFIKIRRKTSDFKKRTHVKVLVPICEDCYSYEVYRLDRDDWRPPDVLPKTWKKDLREAGVTRKELKRFEIREYWSIVNCYRCKRSLRFDRHPVYIEDMSLDSYFPELYDEDATGYRYAPKWMKDLVYKVYKGRCFGCNKKVKPTGNDLDSKSIDHVHPHSKGGETQLLELQLLCRACDNKKADAVPEDEYIFLHFPLVPAPCEAWEDLIW